MAQDQFLEKKLLDGTKHLDLEAGIISKITNQDYLIVALITELPFFKVNDVFQLKNTFCRAVVEKDETVIYNQVSSISGMKLHPAFRSLHLESYIGTPIYVRGRLWGTLNFSSIKARKILFSEEQKVYIQTLADEIGQYLIQNEDSIVNTFSLEKI